MRVKVYPPDWFSLATYVLCKSVMLFLDPVPYNLSINIKFVFIFSYHMMWPGDSGQTLREDIISVIKCV